MRIVFSNLRKVIEENLFESYLPAECVFAVDGIENEFPVPINALQSA